MMRAAVNDHTFVVNMRGRDSAIADWVIPRYVPFVVSVPEVEWPFRFAKCVKSRGRLPTLLTFHRK